MSSGDGGTEPSLQQVLAQAPWFAGLSLADQQLVQRSSSEKFVAAGEPIIRAGDASTHWVGVIRGFVQMFVIGSDGREATLSCLGDGDWCGEGSLLKRERRRYDAVALHDSRIALVPLDTFLHLRDHSIGFNHYLQDLMNRRMSALITTLLTDKLLGPEHRVAKCVATLCRPLHAETHPTLDIPQHELALICGLSRQRTNAALQTLEQLGHLVVEFKSLKVVDLAALAEYGNADAP